MRKEDMTEVIPGTIDKVLTRIDKIADKLGIAAKEVWRFTLAAKAVEAKRRFAQAVPLLIMALVAGGWSLHIATMKLPHKIEHKLIAPDNFFVWDKHTPPPLPTYVDDDKGLSEEGVGLIGSGVLTGLVGFMMFGSAISTMIDAVASLKTIEYDSYREIVTDWKS